MSGVVAAGCTGKQPFASRDQALRVLKRTKRRHQLKTTSGWVSIAYLCRYCRKWHLGRNVYAKGMNR